MTVAAILLAAGASQRMGRPKPLVPWDGRPLIVWEVEQLMSSSVDEIVIVTGAHGDDVRRALGEAGRRCVFNPRWPQGRAGSLVCGARAILSALGGAPEAVVIQNVDQPTRADIVDRLVDELRRSRASAVQPEHEGHGGHPVALSSELVPELLIASERTLGLRGILERHPPYRLPMDDEPIVRLDMNTPDDLESGRRLLGVPGP